MGWSEYYQILHTCSCMLRNDFSDFGVDISRDVDSVRCWNKFRVSHLLGVLALQLQRWECCTQALVVKLYCLINCMWTLFIWNFKSFFLNLSALNTDLSVFFTEVLFTYLDKLCLQLTGRSFNTYQLTEPWGIQVYKRKKNYIEAYTFLL
jgi:hypothetical protein